MLITCGILKMVSNVCREVDKVREERDLEEEENVTDLEESEKLMKKDKEGF